MARRELTEKEKEQRRMLNERLKGRVFPPVDVLDIGLPAFDETVYEDKVGESIARSSDEINQSGKLPLNSSSHGLSVGQFTGAGTGCLIGLGLIVSIGCRTHFFDGRYG